MVLALESTTLPPRSCSPRPGAHAAERDGAAADLGRATATRSSSGLATFADQLDASRRATEMALALAEERGDERAAAEERLRARTSGSTGSPTSSWVHRELLTSRSWSSRRPIRAPPSGCSTAAHRAALPRPDAAADPAPTSARRSASSRSRCEMVDGALRAADRRNTVATGMAVALALLVRACCSRARSRARSESSRGGRRASAAATSTPACRRPARRGGRARGARSTTWPSGCRRPRCRSRTSTTSSARWARSSSSPTATGASAPSTAPPRSSSGGASRSCRAATSARSCADRATPASCVVRHPRRTRCCRSACTADRARRRRAAAPHGQVWVAQNIRAQKRVEEALRRSLEEKEVLLREVHHRVKNNLQVISQPAAAAGAQPRTPRRCAACSPTARAACARWR